MNQHQFRIMFTEAIGVLLKETMKRYAANDFDDYFTSFIQTLGDVDFMERFTRLPEKEGAGPVGPALAPPEQRRNEG